MKHIRSLLSTTQALRHVFVTPAQLPRSQFLRLPTTPFLTQSRFASGRKNVKAPFFSGLVKDEDIPSLFIQLVNEENSLDPAVRIDKVLRSLDRTQDMLLQVQAAVDGQPAVCKIVNKSEMRENEKAKQKAAHAAKASLKQIELNWAIDSHDLTHRLKQFTTFLEKGRKVELILTRKKGKRAPTADEIKHLMDRVIQTTKDANAAQVRPMEGRPGHHVVLVVKKE